MYNEYDAAMPPVLQSKEAQEKLYYTCEKITERVLENMHRLHIHVTGELERSIHWEVWNASNGDSAIITFFFNYYAPFVELAVQKGFSVNDPGIEGRLPGKIRSSNYPGIEVRRKNKQGEVLQRLAKPFIKGAVRTHGRILADTLIKYYGAVGGVQMAYGWIPDDAGGKDSLFQANADVMKVIGFVKRGERRH